MSRRALVAWFPGWEARAWEPVVRALEASITPSVEVLTPGEVAFGSRGPSRYFGGDTALAALVTATVDGVAGRQGCCVGVADGVFTAALAARSAAPGAPAVVPPGESRAWLAPQPIGCLGGGYEELVDLLIRLGVRTLGDLAALPGQAVLGRFGNQGAAAHRRARGDEGRPIAARDAPPELSVAVELDPPAERVDSAAFVARGLAADLHDRLDRAGLACGVVVIEAETEHGEALARRWRHEGFLSAAALAERVRWQLDGWLAPSGSARRDGSDGGDRPTAGITLLRLRPEDLHPDRGRQLGFWGGEPAADARASRAFVRVQGMLGPEAVVTAVLGGGRGLAEQVRLVPWGDDRGDDRSDDRGSRRRKARAEPPPPWPGRLAGPAPASMHATAVPAEVLDGSGRPVEVDARGSLNAPPAAVAIGRARPKAVTAWAGPWPIEERWWDRGGRRRARLQVLLEDGDAHLLSREGGRWGVEATYG